ncbi:MAG: DUF3095 domain-containing protein [Pseudomonadota bacterium]
MFYDDLPRQTQFAALATDAAYAPLPDDWVVGVSDIVGSTRAVAEGRYKTVNMVGAAVISAQINASAGRAFPYVFGGDGAGFAHPGAYAETARNALAAVQVWAKEAFGVDLRVGLFRVADIRAAGHEVAVARFQASPAVDYAMFAGGGMAWAEAQMKAGRRTVSMAAPGTAPDLTGLSCRWSHIKARQGTILSVLIAPAPGAAQADVAAVVEEVLGILQNLDRGGHPVPDEGPGLQWPRGGATLEAKVTAADGARTARWKIALQVALAFLFLRFNMKLGGFDPAHYRRVVGMNADFRKFDDGLKMTLDCDAATVAALRAVLERNEGIVRYGLHMQDEAMMTCIVPAIDRDDHVHFIDGAAGGYTQAAMQMKRG